MPRSAQLTRGDLERLYESLGPRLLLYLGKRTGDPGLAADLVQEVFLKLLLSPIRAGSEAQLKSYLYRTAHSRLVDHARKEQRARLLDILPWREPAEHSTGGSDMELAFRRLKPRVATLLWLAYVEEMNHNEIAEVVGVKSGSVKVLLSRARKQLRTVSVDLGLAPEGCV